jgi:hypothetical protein
MSSEHIRGADRSMSWRATNRLRIPRLLLRCMLLAVALLSAMVPSVLAQGDMRTRIRGASRALAAINPSLSRLDDPQRERVVEFVVGNALFTLGHELGHAVITEFNLPVLGREEDAADSFAALALLHVGTDFTHSVLVDAAQGLMLLAARNARFGLRPAFYGEHGLDQQRAYTIVCLMVGSDPATFGDLAQRANLPTERQETCQIDFDQAKTSWLRLLGPHFRAAARPSFWERLISPRQAKTSWLRLLGPHFRAAARPSFWERLISPRARLFGLPESSVSINYGDAPAGSAPYRDMAKAVGLLDEVRDFAARNFAFPRPVTIEAKTCGEPNAYWDPHERRVALCYEFLAFHADLALRR